MYSQLLLVASVCLAAQAALVAEELIWNGPSPGANITTPLYVKPNQPFTFLLSLLIPEDGPSFKFRYSVFLDSVEQSDSQVVCLVGRNITKRLHLSPSREGLITLKVYVEAEKIPSGYSCDQSLDNPRYQIELATEILVSRKLQLDSLPVPAVTTIAGDLAPIVFPLIGNAGEGFITKSGQRLGPEVITYKVGENYVFQGTGFYGQGEHFVGQGAEFAGHGPFVGQGPFVGHGSEVQRLILRDPLRAWCPLYRSWGICSRFGHQWL